MVQLTCGVAGETSLISGPAFLLMRWSEQVFVGGNVRAEAYIDGRERHRPVGGDIPALRKPE